MRPMPPCKDCEDRELGCHSKCKKYQEYTEKMKEIHKAKDDWYNNTYWKTDQARSLKERRSLCRTK